MLIVLYVVMAVASVFDRQPFEIKQSAAELPVYRRTEDSLKKEVKPQERCDKCERKATKFCVTCQLRLCSKHEEVSNQGSQVVPVKILAPLGS